MATTLDEHAEIREAIVARRPGQAERAMRRHLDVVIERLTGFERQHPDFFAP